MDGKTYIQFDRTIIAAYFEWFFFFFWLAFSLKQAGQIMTSNFAQTLVHHGVPNRGLLYMGFCLVEIQKKALAQTLALILFQVGNNSFLFILVFWDGLRSRATGFRSFDQFGEFVLNPCTFVFFKVLHCFGKFWL